MIGSRTAVGQAQGGPVEVVFRDVAQGDAVVVRSPEGSHEVRLGHVD